MTRFEISEFTPDPAAEAFISDLEAGLVRSVPLDASGVSDPGELIGEGAPLGECKEFEAAINETLRVKGLNYKDFTKFLGLLDDTDEDKVVPVSKAPVDRETIAADKLNALCQRRYKLSDDSQEAKDLDGEIYEFLCDHDFLLLGATIATRRIFAERVITLDDHLLTIRNLDLNAEEGKVAFLQEVTQIIFDFDCPDSEKKEALNRIMHSAGSEETFEEISIDLQGQVIEFIGC